MGKGLLDLIVDSIIDDEWVGRRGEKLTEKELKRVGRRGFEGEILRNIYLPKENGETSEVDVVYITQYSGSVVKTFFQNVFSEPICRFNYSCSLLRNSRWYQAACLAAS